MEEKEGRLKEQGARSIRQKEQESINGRTGASRSKEQ